MEETVIQTSVYVSKVEREMPDYRREDGPFTTVEFAHDSRAENGAPRLKLDWPTPDSARLVLVFNGDERRIEPGDRLLLTIEKLPPLPASDRDGLPF